MKKGFSEVNLLASFKASFVKDGFSEVNLTSSPGEVLWVPFPTANKNNKGFQLPLNKQAQHRC